MRSPVLLLTAVHLGGISAGLLVASLQGNDQLSLLLAYAIVIIVLVASLLGRLRGLPRMPLNAVLLVVFAGILAWVRYPVVDWQVFDWFSLILGPPMVLIPHLMLRFRAQNDALIYSDRALLRELTLKSEPFYWLVGWTLLALLSLPMDSLIRRYLFTFSCLLYSLGVHVYYLRVKKLRTQEL